MGEIQTTAVVDLCRLLTPILYIMQCPHLLHGKNSSSVIVQKDIGGLVPLKQWPFLVVILSLVQLKLNMIHDKGMWLEWLRLHGQQQILL